MLYLMKNKIFFVLIILDLIWAISALVYDLSAIGQIPIYFWPFIIICPIYPFLLALVWYQKVKYNHTNSYLLAFAAVPSAAYFIGALIYYPTFMVSNGFNILALGAIFWVAFYGLQGFYLLITNKLSKISQLLAILFLVISFIIQYLTKTYDYLNLDGLSNQVIIIVYFFTFINLILYLFLANSIRIVFTKLKNSSL